MLQINLNIKTVIYKKKKNENNILYYNELF